MNSCTKSVISSLSAMSSRLDLWTERIVGSVVLVNEVGNIAIT